MLKEYLAEALSLLTEAILGQPVAAKAGCPYQECSSWYCDSCNFDCPYNKKRCQRFCRTCDPCFGGECTPYWLDTQCKPC